MGRFVAFGEVMLRMSAPGRELLLQTPRFDVWVAGAEANVATQLAQLGHETALISAVPRDALGDAAIRHLRGYGVDTRGIHRRAGRMGLYFATIGAGLRPANVLYDRANSAFAETPSDAWDWDSLLAGADRLHLSGITPALGASAARSALAAAMAATRLGVSVSFDGNYRSRLWETWDSDPKAILSEIVEHADILFGNHKDMSLLLGVAFDGSGPGRRREAAQATFARFPKLKLIASTARHADDADHNRVTARVDTRERGLQSEEARITGIVDRIGAGDAFASGVLHAVRNGMNLEQIAEVGLAMTALKHSLPGDAGLFGLEDLDGFLQGGFDVRR